MTLSKATFQNFVKRLRKMHDKHPERKPIKYYAAGEYGGKRHRPHYHAIIFNADKDEMENAWKGAYYQKDYDQLIINGDIQFGTVTEDSVAYTAKYIDKGRKIPMFKSDDRLPEFQLFSKGLGANYLDSKQTIEFHQSSIDRLYVTVNGFKKALPRYFRLKIYSDYQRELQAELAQLKSNEKIRQQYEEYNSQNSTDKSFDKWIFEKKLASIKHHQAQMKRRKEASEKSDIHIVIPTDSFQGVPNIPSRKQKEDAYWHDIRNSLEHES